MSPPPACARPGGSSRIRSGSGSAQINREDGNPCRILCGEFLWIQAGSFGTPSVTPLGVE